MPRFDARSLILVFVLVMLCIGVRLMVWSGWLAPNVSMVAAAGLLAGSLLRARWAVVVPLAAMVVSDAVIGSYDGAVMASVYAMLLAPVGLGVLLRSPRVRGAGVAWRAAAVGGAAVSSSVLFFVGSNLAVWVFTPWYPATLEGLAACFTAALPFFKYTLAGDMVFAGLLFGSAAMVRGAAWSPALRVGAGVIAAK